MGPCAGGCGLSSGHPVIIPSAVRARICTTFGAAAVFLVQAPLTTVMPSEGLGPPWGLDLKRAYLILPLIAVIFALVVATERRSGLGLWSVGCAHDDAVADRPTPKRTPSE